MPSLLDQLAVTECIFSLFKIMYSFYHKLHNYFITVNFQLFSNQTYIILIQPATIWKKIYVSYGYSKTADQLARMGSQHPFIGPEPACSISVGVANKAVRDWTNEILKEYWESITGFTQAKRLIQGSSARRMKDLLKLNRDQLRWMVGLLTGHCHLKGHLFKLRLTGDPICERSLEDHKSATHILCDCEAVAHIRFWYLPPYTKSYTSFEVWD
jgi:hypothetical protein